MATRAQEPEVLDPEEDGTPVASEQTALMQVTKGEVDMQISTAKRFPRSVAAFMKQAASLVTLSVNVAESCTYSVPRAGKFIVGPSSRFFEIVAYEWGNIRMQATPVGEDDRFVTVRGGCWDIEKNVMKTIDVRRRITDSKGKKFNEDMIGVTTAAATSIALRNSTQQTIPKAYWLPLWEASVKVVKGDAKTLEAKRAHHLQWLKQEYGVTQEQVFGALGVKGAADITLEHIPVLVGFDTALKEGRSVEDIFSPGAASEFDQSDPLDSYLSSLEAAEQAEIRGLIDQLKLNKGATAVLLRKHLNKPAALLADLKAQALGAAKDAAGPPDSKAPAKSERHEGRDDLDGQHPASRGARPAAPQPPVATDRRPTQQTGQTGPRAVPQPTQPVLGDTGRPSDPDNDSF